jgi:Fe-S cluster biogenesis protein NfuA
MHDINLSFETESGETIRVDASPSMIFPQLCTFTVSQPLYPDWSAHFAAAEQSKGSPLVDKLFGLDFVGEVLVGENALTITLNKETDWEDAIPKVGGVIRDVLVSGESPISEAVTKAMLPPEELERRVQKVLDEAINPQIASHGGSVTLSRVENNSVYLEFAGGCQGCGMANLTLKYGVERVIREEVPQVGEVRDTTDHTVGQNPYHAPPTH